MRISKSLRPFMVGVLTAVGVALMVFPVVARDIRRLPQEEVVPQAFDGLSPWVIPAAAFGPRRTGDEYNFLYEGGYTRGGYGCLMAPISLPNGATIDRIYASVYDNDGAGYVRVYVHRLNNYFGTVDEMAYMQTSNAGMSTAMQVLIDDTIQKPDVLYPNYSYYVLTCLDTDQTRLYSVRVYYDTHVFVPVVVKVPPGAVPTPTTTPEPTTTPGPSFEDQVISLINAERNSRGLATLKKSSLLAHVAEAHSIDMRDRDFFSHINPDGLDFPDRLANAGYDCWGSSENIGGGYDTPQRMFDWWMNSTLHRNNILNPTRTEIGVGYVSGGSMGHYWTALFGTPK